VVVARTVVATDPEQTLLVRDRINDLDVALYELDAFLEEEEGEK
jgi:hypothetical protein